MFKIHKKRNIYLEHVDNVLDLLKAGGNSLLVDDNLLCSPKQSDALVEVG